MRRLQFPVRKLWTCGTVEINIWSEEIKTESTEEGDDFVMVLMKRWGENPVTVGMYVVMHGDTAVKKSQSVRKLPVHRKHKRKQIICPWDEKKKSFHWALCSASIFCIFNEVFAACSKSSPTQCVCVCVRVHSEEWRTLWLAMQEVRNSCAPPLRRGLLWSNSCCAVTHGGFPLSTHTHTHLQNTH